MGVRDARGVEVHLSSPPQRIVSLVPSTTETLFALGLGHRVVGCTRFAVYPPEAVKQLAKVGGTKDVLPERVKALKPDLILGNCEENTREIFEALSPIAPVYAAFPKTLDGVIEDLRKMGILTYTQASATRWIQAITDARQRLSTVRPATPKTAAYLIWRKPWMSVNGDTFISRMMDAAGFQNAFEGLPDRFPTVTPTQLRDAQLDALLLSSEPFPFKATHAAELSELTGLPLSRILPVDGESFSWHGVRTAKALDSFADLCQHGWPSFEDLRAP